MPGVFDQLDWSEETNSSTLLQLVSAQLDEQDDIRKRVRAQLEKDYPPSALSWLPTVTWSAPTLVPLSSFDLRGISDWPTWKDKEKIKLFTEKIQSGWHKPLVAVKVPGARYLDPIDGHTRLSVYWKLKRPPLAWVGRTHSATGPWEQFHRQQRGMSQNQHAADFSSIYAQLELATSRAVRNSRAPRSIYTFSDPVMTEISEEQYQELLLARKSARAEHESGHPDRIAAERAVRQARRLRKPIEDTRNTVQEVKLSSERVTTEVDEQHTKLLSARRDAQLSYPAGHPERVKAERAVRKSRLALRTKR